MPSLGTLVRLTRAGALPFWELMNRGFIVIWRKIEDSDLWSFDAETIGFALRCLIKANWKDSPWKGMVVKRGQFISSWDNIARENQLSMKRARTIVSRLKKIDFLASKGTNKFTIYTIVNYDKYQDVIDQRGKQLGKQRASKGQAKGKQRATEEPCNQGNQENQGNQIETPPTPSSDPIPYSQFFEAWNKFAEAFKIPKLLTMTEARRKKLAIRVKEGMTPDIFISALEESTKSDFLMGRSERGWQVNFDWLVKNAENYRKVLEGQYRQSRGSRPGSNAGAARQAISELRSEGEAT